MTQKEIDIQEWKNPDNWSDGFFKAYFSKKDSRLFVPGRFLQKFGITPTYYRNWFGSVVNLGHRHGALCAALHWLALLIGFLTIALIGNLLDK
jgi:hypothetical protein